MELFAEIMDSIKEHATQIYPEELICEYHNIETSFLEKNVEGQKLAARKIRQIKDSITKSEMNINWELFFKKLINKVENGESISAKDIVAVEYTPETLSHLLLQVVEILSKRRNEQDSEKVRLCKSIYGFTTCSNPCAYGTYGSCLFAARKENEPSLAEQMFGNITSVDDYIKEMETAKYSNHATNLKLITTSHKVNNKVFDVILNTVKRARNNEELQNFPICVSLGAIDEEQIIRLKEAGVTRINHNLETSYYNALYLSTISTNNGNGNNENHIDSAIEYKKRLTTLITALKNKISICSGGMFFYGDDEIPEDRILLYLTLNELNKIYMSNSSPFNVYVPLKDIVDESIGWFNAFELSCVDRKKALDSFTIFKSLIAFSLVVPVNHKIVVSAGSKWLGSDYFNLAVELAGGAGLASYLQQVGSERSVAVAENINKRY